MGMQPDVSPYGSQTVTGPAWPNVDEDALSAAATRYEAFAAKITGNVVPQQHIQLSRLGADWTGGGSAAASGEATSIIGGHESNAAHATAVATQLRDMAAMVVRTKTMVNATAQEVQHECEALQGLPIGNTAELIQSRIKMGMAQNVASVTANTGELAGGLGATAGPAAASAAAQQGSGGQDGMQMMMQMAQMAMQLPQQLGQMVTQAPQQLIQQITQPLQQITSMFGGKGASSGALPFSAFTNHPAAGGLGAGAGAGMVRAASLPGSGGLGAASPLLANMAGSAPASVSAVGGAGSSAIGGVAPVSAGGGGMGGSPMMGQRGTSGGTAASLVAPGPLDHDLSEDDVDDDW